MISQKEALSYRERLHPALVGYLHDGRVNRQDALASIFYMMEKGILEPVWEDGSMLKSLKGVKQRQKTPSLLIDKKIIEVAFKSKKEVTVGEIGGVIDE